MLRQSWKQDSRPVRGMFYRPMTVTMRTPNAVALVRADYKRLRLGQEFRDEAVRTTFRDKNHDECYDELLLFPTDIMEYKVHHKVPIFLGGCNSINNLAMVSDGLHEEIHEHINRQISGMRPKDTRRITIPMQAGLIWK